MSVLGFLIIQSVIHLNYCQRNRPTYPPRYKDLVEDYKKKHINYNPTYGYEPYWIDGSWVFDENLPENGPTTSMPQVCGEECNYLYREIGQVCGRLSSNKHSKGCNSWFYCYGDILDDLTDGFQTFDTYCKFLDTQCRSSFEHRWILVHSGPCIERQELSFKPMSSGDEPVSRMNWYFTELEDSLKNHTTLPPLHEFPNI